MRSVPPSPVSQHPKLGRRTPGPVVEASGNASIVLFAVIGASAALFAANLYYAQPLITTIAADLHLKPAFAGAVVSASQFGYGLGLFLLVPLADMVENRRLVLTCSTLTLAGIVGVATAHSAAAFLCFALMIGFFSSGAQILIPYLSHLIPVARRGRTLGIIMAGMLTSIMLARPAALFIAAGSGWRSVYWLSGIANLSAAAALWWLMPRRKPRERFHYLETFSTMFALFASEPRVRRRATYQAVLFAAFTMFWAVIPILLARQYGFSKTMIGCFSLVGAGGVFAAPLAGRIADHGRSWAGTALASLVLIGAFLLSAWSVHMAIPLALAAASLLIDGSVQVSQMLSRVMVLDVAPEIRGRINALYMTIVYVSGALGSVLGVSAYFRWGWSAVATLGVIAGLAVLLGLLVERLKQSSRKPAITQSGQAQGSK